MHVVGHVFKVTLFKKNLLGMVSRYALNEITTEYERVPYAGKNPSHCGFVMRSTHVFHVHVSCINILLVIYHSRQSTFFGGDLVFHIKGYVRHK